MVCSSLSFLLHFFSRPYMWLISLLPFRIDDVELPDVHPKKAFMIGALDKEIRLSFAQRIKGTLPKPYHFLITEGKEKDTPDFKYAEESMLISTSLPAPRS